MDKEFWLSKWDENQLGFHQEDYNQYMVSFFKDYQFKDKSILIPLAGKSKDILWFLDKGFKVFAVEIAEKAIVDFFEEASISYSKDGKTYSSKNLEFICDDLFNLDHKNEYDFIYDRASLVALPVEMRNNLYDLYNSLMTKSSVLFSIVIDYNKELMSGPPFNISNSEIKNKFKDFEIIEFAKNQYVLPRENKIEIQQTSYMIRKYQ